MVKHIFTVDLEDWFCISAPDAPVIDRWHELESRVEGPTLNLLNLLDNYGRKATFFILGWVAERYPYLIKEITRRGHEIANHGYGHQPLFKLSPNDFRNDLRKAEKAIVEAGATKKPSGYRAPYYSLTPRTKWALNLLADEGYIYDASVFPMRRHDGGWPGAPEQPYLTKKRPEFWEVPITPIGFGPVSFIFSAGGYLRIIPMRVVLFCLNKLDREGKRAVFVVHPKDLDDSVPSPTKSLYGQLRQKLHLGSTEKKIKAVLEKFKFGTIEEVINEIKKERKS